MSTTGEQVADEGDTVSLDRADTIPLFVLRMTNRPCVRDGCGHPFTGHIADGPNHTQLLRGCQHTDCRCLVYQPPPDVVHRPQR